MCVDSTTPCYSATSPYLADWPGGGWGKPERGTGAATAFICVGNCSAGGLAGRTASAACSAVQQLWLSPSSASAATQASADRQWLPGVPSCAGPFVHWRTYFARRHWRTYFATLEDLFRQESSRAQLEPLRKTARNSALSRLDGR